MVVLYGKLWGKYTSPMDAYGISIPTFQNRFVPFPSRTIRSALWSKKLRPVFSVESFFGPFESMLFLEDSAAQG